MRTRTVATLVVLAAALAGALLAALSIGVHDVSFARALDATIPRDQNIDRTILLSVRLPRALFGAVAGGILAMAGATFQALLRNDLATPYTLGVSGGASLAALGAMTLGAGGVLVAPASLVGAAVAVAAVLLLASAAGRGSGARIETILLGGVTLNLLFSSGILVVQFLADPYEAYGIVRWLMGGLDVTALSVPLGVGAGGLAGFAVLLWQARALNVMTLGDDAALHLGFDPQRARLVCLAAASGATALVVAWSGPIGFVGLIVPHAVRRVLGPDHRTLLPATLLAGAVFLVACDALGRAVGGVREIPVGIITSLVGGPFFLALLVQRRN
jgi:iron complex transport system permease protein